MRVSHALVARNVALSIAATAAALPLLATSAQANANRCAYSWGLPRICFSVHTDAPGKPGNYINYFRVDKNGGPLEYYIVGTDANGRRIWTSPKRSAKQTEVVCNFSDNNSIVGSKFLTPCHKWPGAPDVSKIALQWGEPGAVVNMSPAVEIKEK
jgi:hypothetical protein